MRNSSSLSRVKSARALLTAAAITAMLPLAAHATLLYSDNFNISTDSSNYNVYHTQSSTPSNTGSVAFGFNYGSSSLGIPQAPNTLSDTGATGLMVQSDTQGSTASSPWLIGAVSVATKGLSLPSQYVVSCEVWGNYLGGTSINDANATNGSTGATMGIASASTGVNYAVNNPSAPQTLPLVSQGGLLVDAIRDASASGGTYRAYASGVNYGNTNGTYSVYQASGGSNAATTAQMYTNSYYTGIFPAVSAPTAQSSAATTQLGLTQPGEFGFAWHAMTLTQDGTNVTWSIDGHTIATIPDSDFTAGGQQVSFGDQDGNTSGNNSIYNFDVFDDFTVSTLPEPASLSFLGIAGLAMIRRRRQA